MGGGTGAEGSGSIFSPAIMSEEEVEQVTDFKYLGTEKLPLNVELGLAI